MADYLYEDKRYFTSAEKLGQLQAEMYINFVSLDAFANTLSGDDQTEWIADRLNDIAAQMKHAYNESKGGYMSAADRINRGEL